MPVVPAIKSLSNAVRTKEDLSELMKNAELAAGQNIMIGGFFKENLEARERIGRFE